MREVVTRSRMAIFVMRYLLLPLMILATTHSLYSQTGVYVVAPLDLSRGYAIAEGGTITVAGGNITEWDISVTGEFPFRFMTGQPMVALDAGFEISDTRIDTSTDLPSGAGFRAVAPCPAAFLPAPALCEFDLAWTTSETGSFRGYLMKSSDNFTINAGSVTTFDPDFTLVARLVPEPSGLCLGLVGMGLVGAWRKRTHANRVQHSIHS